MLDDTYIEMKTAQVKKKKAKAIYVEAAIIRKSATDMSLGFGRGSKADRGVETLCSGERSSRCALTRGC